MITTCQYLSTHTLSRLILQVYYTGMAYSRPSANNFAPANVTPISAVTAAVEIGFCVSRLSTKTKLNL